MLFQDLVVEVFGRPQDLLVGHIGAALRLNFKDVVKVLWVVEFTLLELTDKVVVSLAPELIKICLANRPK